MVGFSGSKDQIGTFFAITLPIMLHLWPPLIIISLFGLFISKSSFAMVAGLSSGLFYAYFRCRRLFYSLLALFIFCGGMFFMKIEQLNLQDFKTRIDVWKHSVQAITAKKIDVEFRGNKIIKRCNPLLGYGFSTFNNIFPYVPQKENFNYRDEKFTHAHNDYVEIFFELGVVGFLALIMIIVGMFKDFIRQDKTREFVLYFSCILAFGLNAMGNFVASIAVSGMLLIVFYGLLRGEQNG